MWAHLAVALFVALAVAPPARGSDVPSFPLSQAQSPSNSSSPSNAASRPCHLDLSAELFGGVAAACGAGGGPGSLDRGRCCPVLAAWLFAAHARTALSVPPAPPPSALAGDEGMGPDGGDDGPMVPYDNQRCVDALGAALERRGVALPRPNATCDTVLCFCGIRLHQIGSLRCPAAFAVKAGAAARNATPTAAVKALEKSCRNASYAGCSRCVQSLQKLPRLHLHPPTCAAEGEREPRGLRRRRRPRAADAGAGLPADGPHVAAGQEQDGLHPHRLRRAARHALHRAPDGVRQRRRGAAVQP
ncbi:uncharacterized protein [Zea mays]|uniref:SPARK domain-containing protein n=1 Tax=Zea mays TaxID=4577 RepID=A0A804MRT3_MAIZE|nr:uncharacterized protein LOC103647750 isoform X1 [Zea mays]|eukprot:XP_008670488.1 uncharacterized GPI-anchored protein At4g28100 isoform X2 [Zea mays]